MFQGINRRVAYKIQTHENVAEHSLVCAGWGRGGFSLAWQCSANHSVRTDGICCSGSIMAWGGRKQKQSGWQEFHFLPPAVLFSCYVCHKLSCSMCLLSCRLSGSVCPNVLLYVLSEVCQMHIALAAQRVVHSECCRQAVACVSSCCDA